MNEACDEALWKKKKKIIGWAMDLSKPVCKDMDKEEIGAIHEIAAIHGLFDYRIANQYLYKSLVDHGTQYL